jgi:uncharacterized protein
MPAAPDPIALKTAGIGWRHPHYAQVLETLPSLAFLEVHSENFFALGGATIATLEQARQHYSISLHGVGLGLGSANGIDAWHLDRLHQLVQRIDPVRVSDHACFARGSVAGMQVHAADLLPIAFNTASLDVLCTNVQRVQDRLQRAILVENLSAYVNVPGSDRSEIDFLNDLTLRTGCQLLVDVNNLFVNALNVQPAAQGARNTDCAVAQCCAWIEAVRPGSTGEIHLAGHCEMDDIVIDDHGAVVCDSVWRIYAHAVQRLGPMATLIEWDTAIPALQILLNEADRANAVASQFAQNGLHHHGLPL